METQKKDALFIYWLKKDFRLTDNPALSKALEAAKFENAKLALVYVIEDELLSAPETSVFHVEALRMALSELQKSISKNYGQEKEVAIFKGNALEIFEKIYQKTPFQKLFSHQETGNNWTFERDKEILSFCKSKNIDWIESLQTGVFRRLKSRDERTKLWNKLIYSPLLLSPLKEDFEYVKVPNKWKDRRIFKEHYIGRLEAEDFGFSKEGKEIQSVTEMAALQTLEDFLYYRGIAYRGGISSPNKAFTAGSRLSVHLAWGTISVRYVFQKTKKRLKDLKIELAPLESKLKNENLSEKQKKELEIAIKTKKRWRGSLTSFLSRLHWRDHFIQRLETEPQMEFEALNPAYEQLEYENNPVFLKAWLEGKTGFSLVDACMRCLNTTGFLNFRMRAMISSVAMHTLHLSWKTVNAPMAKLYTDYEAGIHLSQLQMQGGVVGINTLRVYSPTKQLIDHDPDCDFVKEWIPELRPHTSDEIISHAENPEESVIKGYPKPVVDWKEASKKMKDMVYKIRKEPQTKEISQKVYLKHGSRKGSMASRRKKKEHTLKDSVKIEKS